MSGFSFSTFKGTEGRSLSISISLLNLSAIAILVVGLALVGGGVIDPAELMLAAIAATGAAWAVRRSSSAALSRTPAIGLMSGLFPVILAVFVLRSFVAEPFAIPSGSMLPTLQEGDFIVVNRHAYGLRMPVRNSKLIETGRPKRGDVVVFRFPKNPNVDYIKRVVGLPGDMVVYANKELVINGRAARYADLGKVDGSFSVNWVPLHGRRESIDGKEHSVLLSPGTPAYNPKHVQTFPYQENCSYRVSGFACRVPEGQYLVLGDNRDGSQDSRYWGFVPDENLIGRASFVWMNFRQPARIGLRVD